jgi:hypothetical protein
VADATIRVVNHGATFPGPPKGAQDVLNASWPLVDENGEPHARGIPARDPIPVRVRITFERDGDVWLDGLAVRWHGRHVCVECGDPRLRVRYVWVAAGDVIRR